MKKLLLSITFLLALFSFREADAQTWIPNSGSSDTVSLPYTVTGDLFVYNNLKATASGATVHIRWHITASNFTTGMSSTPDGWTFGGFCDNHLCYPPLGGVGTLNGVSHVSNYTDTFSDFHAIFNGSAAPVGTSAWVTVHVEDTVSGDSRDLTFIANKTSAGVVSTMVTDGDFSMWPNPALGALNIMFDPNAGIRYAGIFNMIGKDVAHFRVVGNSARLDIDNLPPGVYMVRLITGDGQVAVTRRFTHQ